MAINKEIFKSYDIRGIYPSELNEEVAFEIGRAFIRKTKAKSAVVAQDARLASPALFRALTAGLSAEGAKVYDIGQTPTECLYFAVGTHGFDAGVMVTASHNPKEYDGFKSVVKDGKDIQIISGKDLLAEVKDDNSMPGELVEIEKKDIWHDYINHVLSFVDLSEIVPMKIVVDASSGVAGHAISRLQDKLPVEIIPLNFEPNGNFPNHAPNPLLEGSADQIKKEIIKQKADCGFIFDGDADRVYLITEEGEFVKADITLTLLAKYFLQKNPGAGIAFHVTCSKSVGEFVKKYGGRPIRTKVGFINIQKGLRENDGVMGGELSGHYCFKDNYYSDSGMIAFLTLLQIISQDGRKVSEIMKELSIYVKDPEINFEVKDKDAMIEKIKQKYADGRQDTLDGVTIEYKDWWFNVRPSNTELLLRLTVEADTQEILEEKQRELTKLISDN
jgi:phosphomannomutase